MAKKQEILLMDKGFMKDVVETLKTIDVRGYESNKRLVIITMEMERAINTNLPFEIEPNKPNEQSCTDPTSKTDKDK